MQDKLFKILKIKIEAINRNIDNLNYLNGELEKNNDNLEYMEGMISLFKDNDVLNFDKINKEDFEKILLMVDSRVADIFKDKTCNYDGIIYIIEGIRQSISLELTSIQSNAILAFIEGMRAASLNFREIITNLSESKKRLPETDLSILSNNLENYQNIVSKIENNLYLTEIDEIADALDFANVLVDEKADVFEYVLKYNASIYSSRETYDDNNSSDNDKEHTESTEDLKFDFDLPTFNYEPLEINDNNEKEEDVANDLQDELDNTARVEIPITTFDENPDSSIENNQEVENEQITQMQIPDFEENINLESNSDFAYEMPNTYGDIDNSTNDINLDNDYSDGITNDESSLSELNTMNLDDIIQKIDLKLNELKNEEEVKKEEVNENSNLTQTEIPSVQVASQEPLNEEKKDVVEDLNSVYLKYDLPDLGVSISKNDLEANLEVLNANDCLDIFKEKISLLSLVVQSNRLVLNEVLSLIKSNLVTGSKNYHEVLEILVETMPILFTKEEVGRTFKANIEFFQEKGINVINLFDNYRELFIFTNILMIENYDIITRYGLKLDDDNVKYLLYNKNLSKNIDYYLEAMGVEKGFLGREDVFDGLSYITKNPFKLNEVSSDTLMKLRYASENGIKIYGNKPGILSGEISNHKVDVLKLDDDYKKMYFNGEYGFVDRSELLKLKEDIDNDKSFDTTLDGNLNALDSKYKVSDLRYKFGNVLISRMKAIRIYNFLKNRNLSLRDALLIALTYNSVIKQNEYEEIEKVVNNITVGGN